jgi:V8-like Glu-specific endopeptidase
MMPRLWATVPPIFACFLLLSPPGAAVAKPLPASPPSAVVGVSHAVAVEPELQEARTTADGQVWEDEIVVADASFLKAHLVDVQLRPGDTLTLRTATGKVVEVIRDRGPADWGTFWALSSQGEVLSLEFRFRGSYERMPFRIDEIIVGDPDAFGGGGGPGAESICEPPDFDDVFCFRDDPGKWSNVLAAAGVMTVDGDPRTALWCSASCVSPHGYVLTNEHCVSSAGDCNTAEFVFRYYRQGCNDGSPTTPDWQGFRCAEIVEQQPFITCEQGLGQLDFSLCALQGNPALEFGYVRPDPVPLTDGEAIYIIQHPDGRPHEITHGAGANVDVDGTVLRYYDTLDTEPGSSGSPIFRESDDRLIGLHHCGGCDTPGEGNRGMLMADIYPLIEEYLCSPSPMVGGLTISDFAELNGNGDTVLDPGETWAFLPELTNQTCSGTLLALHGTVRVAAASEHPVRLKNADVDFGDVAAGEVGTAAQWVEMTVGRDVTCGGNVVLDMVEISADNGGPFDDQPGFLVQQIGKAPQEVVFSDDFSAGLEAWTVIHGGTGSGPAATWTTTNPGDRSLSLTAPFAIADSDELGSGYNMDEELISPEVDLGDYVEATVQFKHDFHYYSGSGDEIADVDVRSSVTSGWVNVKRFQNGDASGFVSLDITPYAAGQSDVQVRFHYYNARYDWWWAVDDVVIVGGSDYLCGGPFFTEYGSGCEGSAGYEPHLSASGEARAGEPIMLQVDGGLPGSDGEFFVSLRPDTTSLCERILDPVTGPFPLALDGSGGGSLQVVVPVNAPPGKRVYVQWTGQDPQPPLAKSNGLEIFVQ